MGLFKGLVDNKSGSMATQMRKRRFSFFMSLLDNVPRPIKMLDVGGTYNYWRMMGMELGDDFDITLINTEETPNPNPQLKYIIGDGRHMPEFEDQSFDVVFSNSVIEHVGLFEDQRRMAQEVARVGKRYFIQTPNFHFPLEPHFLLPFFQYYPVPVRVWLIRHMNLGWMKKTPDLQEARELILHTRLLKKKEMQSLFPSAQIYEEKMYGLTKSFVAYKGFDQNQD